MDEIVPVTAIVMSIGVAFWSMYLEHQKKRLQFEERRLMIEKGIAPPPMLPEEPRRWTPSHALRRGVVLLSLGIGFVVAGVVAAGTVDENFGGVLGVVAAITGFLGLGNLAFYFMTRNKPDETQTPPPMPM